MKIIGHRGARGLAPENTLASLRKALDHHVDEIEIDVWVTKDNVVVLDHDGELTDPDGRKRKIAGHNLEELKRHKPDLATLEEAIQTVNRAVPLLIEVKPGVPTGPIIDLLKSYLKKTSKPADFVLGSKNQRVLLELHAALPELQKVVIHGWSGVIATRRAKAVQTKRLSMNQRWLWKGFLRRMSRGGWQLAAYTCNNPKKARKWQGAGLSAVITDYPDLYET